MKNMENLEEMFISARRAKMNTNNHIREQEEFYQKKAIDFLNKYNFNQVVLKACEERTFFISPVQIEEKELAYAIRSVLLKLGYNVKVNNMLDNTYSISVNWTGNL